MYIHPCCGVLFTFKSPQSSEQSPCEVWPARLSYQILVYLMNWMITCFSCSSFLFMIQKNIQENNDKRGILELLNYWIAIFVTYLIWRDRGKGHDDGSQRDLSLLGHLWCAGQAVRGAADVPGAGVAWNGQQHRLKTCVLSI